MDGGHAVTVAAEVVLKWADGDYLFRLPIRELCELERRCGAGVGEITARVFGGRPYVMDIVETIRLGLIGGGTATVRAQQLVATYVDGKPLADPDDPSSPYKTALAVLRTVYFGFDELAREASAPGKGDVHPIG